MTDVPHPDEATKRKLAGDPHRPRYHFLPPANWMNDPNGAIFWKGKYHLFYQYNPNGAFWGTMHWGHAASEDLVHWEHLPIALAPTPGGPDRDGCYSGHAVNNNGVPTFIYYGNPEGNCIAIGSDDMLTWQKPLANPVIPHPPKGQEEWRPWDPCAWKEGDTWYSLSGGAAEGVGDTAFLFRSKDLVHWEYMHRFYESKLDKEPESDCAVPDFFPLGDRYALAAPSAHGDGLEFLGAHHGSHPGAASGEPQLAKNRGIANQILPPRSDAKHCGFAYVVDNRLLGGPSVQPPEGGGVSNLGFTILYVKVNRPL